LTSFIRVGKLSSDLFPRDRLDFASLDLTPTPFSFDRPLLCHVRIGRCLDALDQESCEGSPFILRQLERLSEHLAKITSHGVILLGAPSRQVAQRLRFTGANRTRESIAKQEERSGSRPVQPPS
jgi:hypothetical protein